MLDTNVDKILSIEVAVPEKVENKRRILLLRACKVYVFGNGRIYSELEEQTFDYLNSNEGYGVLDIEFVFENNVTSKNYPTFCTKCFAMRTDTNIVIKPMKSLNKFCNSKINQNGELVVGIRYFFRNERDIERIKSSKSLLVEGFIALEKTINVYGVMCQMQRTGKNWKIVSAYTYKPLYARNIKNLID